MLQRSIRAIWSLTAQCNVKRSITTEAKKAVKEKLPALADKCGRFHSYLRISLTERCSLRCHYCMPENGVDLTPDSQLLNADEIQRLASIFVEEGVTKIRLSGGEPLLRKDIVPIVAGLNELRSNGLKTIAMTTNGIVLSRHLPALVKAGLNAVNISLDTMDPIKFQLITKRLGFEKVLKSIDDALDSCLHSVKVNCVLMNGINVNELAFFVDFTKFRDAEVRFIEFMPFADNTFDRRKYVPYQAMLETIKLYFPDIEKYPAEPNETSKVYRIPGYQGRIGFISSMSEHFCNSCNRLRLTADGNLKVCLFDKREVSLRDAIRSGSSNDELRELVGQSVKLKKPQHAGLDVLEATRSSNRPMITIGG